MADISRLSRVDKIRLIRTRFRMTEDLWIYMTTRMGAHLPPLKKTPRKFLTDCMLGRKKFVLQRDVPSKEMPRWPELSVQRCYPMIVESAPEVLEYLPDPTGINGQILPDRTFFWRVLYSIMPQKVEEYISQVDQQRKQKPNLQDETFKVQISDEFMDELLRYDYTSRKKGRGSTSLFCEIKPRVNQQRKQRQEEQIKQNSSIIRAPKGGDVSIWYKKLTPAQQAAYKRGLQGLSASGIKSEADFRSQNQNNVNGFDSALGEEIGGIQEEDEFQELNDSQHHQKN